MAGGGKLSETQIKELIKSNISNEKQFETRAEKERREFLEADAKRGKGKKR